MNEEQLKALQERIINEPDPARQQELMDTLTFVMGNRQVMTPTFDGGGTYRPAMPDLTLGATDPVIPGSANIPLPTIGGPPVNDYFGETENPFAGLTAGEISALLAQRQGAAQTGVNQDTGLPDGVYAYTQPTRDLFQQAGLGPGSQFVEQLLGSRQSQIDTILQRQKELQGRLTGLESGDISVAQSQLPDRFKVATNREDFARLRDEGFIPIMAQDSEMIRRMGQEQAQRIRMAADADLKDATAARRAAIFQQMASGLGIGIASAISRTNAGADGTLDRAAALAEQTRQDLTGARRRRNAADISAGEFDTRAQLDAMLAETDAFRQVQNMLTQSARDDELRRFAEIERAKANMEAAQRDLDNIRGNEAAFMTNLVQAQKLANDPVPTQLVTDPSLRRTGRSSFDINRNLQTRLVRAAGRLRQNLDAINSRSPWFRKNEVADAPLIEYQQEIKAIVEDLDKLDTSVVLSDDVQRILAEALDLDAATSNVVSRGGEGQQPGVNFQADTEDILYDETDPTNILINQRLDSILNATQGGLAESVSINGVGASRTVSDVQKAAGRFSRGAN